MRIATAAGILLALAACAHEIDDGSGGGDPAWSGGELSQSASSSTATVTAGGACSAAECAAPDVCVLVPGSAIGRCGSRCESDHDCAAWFTCQNGVCAGCSTCPAGQMCSSVLRGPVGVSGGECPLGTYATTSEETGGVIVVGGCQGIELCRECVGPCADCTSNSQCGQGQVCADGRCVACSSDGQCGPSAKCEPTHTGTQCTCFETKDCAPGESCQSRVCTPLPTPSCYGLMPPACAPGQACIGGACGACSTFEDCNTASFGAQLSGLTCIAGVCSACTANSQCGGGEACVQGTCGTCSANAQCGPAGQCSRGVCACSTDGQCGAGQRCGWGVCVAT
jgi:hypothetical protein